MVDWVVAIARLICCFWCFVVLLVCFVGLYLNLTSALVRFDYFMVSCFRFDSILLVFIVLLVWLRVFFVFAFVWRFDEYWFVCYRFFDLLWDLFDVGSLFFGFYCVVVLLSFCDWVLRFLFMSVFWDLLVRLFVADERGLS